MSRILLLATCLLAATSLSVPAFAATEHFHADLKGSSEVPPNDSAGTGAADATLDAATKSFSYTVTWSGLSGAAIMAHFHGPAAPGTNAGVLVPLGMSAGLTPPLQGKVTLTDSQIGSLEAGMWYVNVHTPAHKGGEIRGQVVKTPM